MTENMLTDVVLVVFIDLIWCSELYKQISYTFQSPRPQKRYCDLILDFFETDQGVRMCGFTYSIEGLNMDVCSVCTVRYERSCIIKRMDNMTVRWNQQLQQPRFKCH